MLVNCIFNLVASLTFLQTIASEVSNNFCECRFMYGCLAHDRWAVDWEKGRVARKQTGGLGGSEVDLK